jgi:hypothetical protein
MGTVLLVIGLLVCLVLVVVVVRWRRSMVQPNATPASADDEICLFCRKPFAVGEKFVALLKPYARELLGAEPTDLARGPNDKQGDPRWLAHENCVRVAQKNVCMFCEEGIMPSEEVAGFPRPDARDVLGAEPTERAATTDPMGRPCYVAHADCARTYVKDLQEHPYKP